MILVGLNIRQGRLLTGRNHKLFESLKVRLECLRANFVEKEQGSSKFGDGGSWHDAEADEVDLRKGLLLNANGDYDEKVSWEQWCGVVEHGTPRILCLVRLDPIRTNKMAPVSGPIRKRDWKTIDGTFLKNRCIILHTDGARAYKMAVPRLIHDNVVQKRKW